MKVYSAADNNCIEFNNDEEFIYDDYGKEVKLVATLQKHNCCEGCYFLTKDLRCAPKGSIKCKSCQCFVEKTTYSDISKTTEYTY